MEEAVVIGGMASLLAMVLTLVLYADRKDVTAVWAGRTVRSVRSLRHTLTVDGVVVAVVPSGVAATARVSDPVLGSFDVESRPTRTGTSLFVNGAWVGGARPPGVEGEPAKAPEPQDPRWVACRAALDPAHRHPDPELRAAAAAVERSALEALLAAERVRGDLEALASSAHPSAEAGRASLQHTLDAWEEAVTARLGAAEELHRAAVGSGDGGAVRDAVQRVRAAAEVQHLSVRARASQRGG